MPNDSYSCRNCQSGVVRLKYVTYFTWLRKELITVPNFPAWVCDVCGKREYDQRAVAWLTMLLNPNTGKPSSAEKKQTHPAAQNDNKQTSKISHKEKR